jgi:hypothetical protein
VVRFGRKPYESLTTRDLTTALFQEFPMPDPSTHPSREELSAYSLGQLPPDEAAAIDSHISECQPCCETIVGMSSDDTFVGLLQEAGSYRLIRQSTMTVANLLRHVRTFLSSWPSILATRFSA